MCYSAFRTSHKFYFHRPAAQYQAARIAWDCLTLNGTRDIVSMRLLDGDWMAKLPNGEMDDVDASWITNQTPRVLKSLSKAADRRAAQGKA